MQVTMNASNMFDHALFGFSQAFFMACPILDVCEVREEEIREQQLRDLAAQAGSLTIRNPAHAMSDSDAMFDIV
jgi:hypothetical protein